MTLGSLLDLLLKLQHDAVVSSSYSLQAKRMSEVGRDPSKKIILIRYYNSIGRLIFLLYYLNLFIKIYCENKIQ